MGQTQPQKPLVKCPKCGTSVRKDRLDKHMRELHKHQPVQRKVWQPNTITVYLPKKEVQKQIEQSNRSSLSKIFLKSKRCTRLKNGGQCDECGVSEQLVWRYADSNRGSVQICSRCKDEVLDRSFGTRDVLDESYEGGAFETNPRRH